MAHIRTIEDGFQYQINRAIKTVIKNYDLQSLTTEELEVWLNEHPKELGEIMLDRIEDYCGIQDAIQAEY